MTAPQPNRIAHEAAALLPDIARLVAGLARDPRVPQRAKVEAVALLAAGFGPWDALPVVGELSVLAMGSLALRRLLRLAGEDLVREHWQGSDTGLQLVRAVVASGPRPGRLAVRLAALAAKARDGSRRG